MYEERFHGLKNQGATCYLNSLLQAIFHVQPFRKFIVALSFPPAICPVLREFQNLFRSMMISSSSVSTRALTKAFGWRGDDVFIQHDVNELFLLLFERIEVELKRIDELILQVYEKRVHEVQQQGQDISLLRKPSLLLPYFNNLFSITTEHYIHTIRSHHHSVREESCKSIVLPVKGFPTLFDSFCGFHNQTQLFGSNSYEIESSDGTKTKEDALMGMRLKHLPQYMFISLSRYDISPKGRVQKLTDFMSFPTILDFCEFIRSPLSLILQHKKLSSDSSDTSTVASEIDGSKPGFTSWMKKAFSGLFSSSRSIPASSISPSSPVSLPSSTSTVTPSTSSSFSGSSFFSSSPLGSPFGISLEGLSEYAYRLKSVIVHRGGSGRGHYMCIVRSSSGKNVLLNDSKVSYISDKKLRGYFGKGKGGEEGKRSVAYMLVYERIPKVSESATSQEPMRKIEERSLEEEKKIESDLSISFEKELSEYIDRLYGPQREGLVQDYRTKSISQQIPVEREHDVRQYKELSSPSIQRTKFPSVPAQYHQHQLVPSIITPKSIFICVLSPLATLGVRGFGGFEKCLVSIPIFISHDATKKRNESFTYFSVPFEREDLGDSPIAMAVKDPIIFRVNPTDEIKKLLVPISKNRSFSLSNNSSHSSSHYGGTKSSKRRISLCSIGWDNKTGLSIRDKLDIEIDSDISSKTERSSIKIKHIEDLISNTFALHRKDAFPQHQDHLQYGYVPPAASISSSEEKATPISTPRGHVSDSATSTPRSVRGIGVGRSTADVPHSPHHHTSASIKGVPVTPLPAHKKIEPSAMSSSSTSSYTASCFKSMFFARYGKDIDSSSLHSSAANQPTGGSTNPQISLAQTRRNQTVLFVYASVEPDKEILGDAVSENARKTILGGPEKKEIKSISITQMDESSEKSEENNSENEDLKDKEPDVIDHPSVPTETIPPHPSVKTDSLDVNMNLYPIEVMVYAPNSTSGLSHSDSTSKFLDWSEDSVDPASVDNEKGSVGLGSDGTKESLLQNVYSASFAFVSLGTVEISHSTSNRMLRKMIYDRIKEIPTLSHFLSLFSETPSDSQPSPLTSLLEALDSGSKKVPASFLSFFVFDSKKTNELNRNASTMDLSSSLKRIPCDPRRKTSMVKLDSQSFDTSIDDLDSCSISSFILDRKFNNLFLMETTSQDQSSNELLLDSTSRSNSIVENMNPDGTYDVFASFRPIVSPYVCTHQQIAWYNSLINSGNTLASMSMPISLVPNPIHPKFSNGSLSMLSLLLRHTNTVLLMLKPLPWMRLPRKYGPNVLFIDADSISVGHNSSNSKKSQRSVSKRKPRYAFPSFSSGIVPFEYVFNYNQPSDTPDSERASLSLPVFSFLVSRHTPMWCICAAIRRCIKNITFKNRICSLPMDLTYPEHSTAADLGIGEVSTDITRYQRQISCVNNVSDTITSFKSDGLKHVEAFSSHPLLMQSEHYVATDKWNPNNSMFDNVVLTWGGKPIPMSKRIEEERESRGMEDEENEKKEEEKEQPSLEDIGVELDQESSVHSDEKHAGSQDIDVHLTPPGTVVRKSRSVPSIVNTKDSHGNLLISGDLGQKAQTLKVARGGEHRNGNMTSSPKDLEEIEEDLDDSIEKETKESKLSFLSTYSSFLSDHEKIKLEKPPPTFHTTTISSFFPSLRPLRHRPHTHFYPPSVVHLQYHLSPLGHRPHERYIRMFVHDECTGIAVWMASLTMSASELIGWKKEMKQIRIRKEKGMVISSCEPLIESHFKSKIVIRAYKLISEEIHLVDVLLQSAVNTPQEVRMLQEYQHSLRTLRIFLDEQKKTFKSSVFSNIIGYVPRILEEKESSQAKDSQSSQQSESFLRQFHKRCPNTYCTFILRLMLCLSDPSYLSQFTIYAADAQNRNIVRLSDMSDAAIDHLQECELHLVHKSHMLMGRYTSSPSLSVDLSSDSRTSIDDLSPMVPISFPRTIIASLGSRDTLHYISALIQYRLKHLHLPCSILENEWILSKRKAKREEESDARSSMMKKYDTAKRIDSLIRRKRREMKKIERMSWVEGIQNSYGFEASSVLDSLSSFSSVSPPIDSDPLARSRLDVFNHLDIGVASCEWRVEKDIGLNRLCRKKSGKALEISSIDGVKNTADIFIYSTPK
ncbi:Ubiquitin-specific peptidase 40 like protein [Aduncisulcus paluster]|uniref:Ubiquitin-specific peptidase 40 like protein n=1 Tax=Aduncisulcus paluster TaxID=2918883 RepID=A0ABQ5KSM9_9EUKA|nr:Ubiquitin-specific peptidase 40 like protein [Aduncisulcus paluster]